MTAMLSAEELATLQRLAEGATDSMGMAALLAALNLATLLRLTAQVREAEARQERLAERWFNAGFDYVGVIMNVRGWKPTHPQWIADRAKAYRKTLEAKPDLRQSAPPPAREGSDK